MGRTAFTIFYSLYSSNKAAGEAQRSQAAGTRSDMQGYWETYQKWGQDASKDYEQNIASAKSNMSASGVKAGTEQWDTNLAGITSEYEKQKEGFDSGVTGSALSNWAKTQQEKVVGTGANAKKGTSTLSTTDYLTQEFGALDLSGKPIDKAAAATTTARQSAAGTTAPKTTTGTPWW